MEDKQSYYSVIPGNVRYDKDLKSNEKLLFGEISALCNKFGYCTATNDYLSKLEVFGCKKGIAVQTISRWIKNLKDKNYIWIYINVDGGNKRKIYVEYATFLKDKACNFNLNFNAKKQVPINTTINRVLIKKLIPINSTVNRGRPIYIDNIINKVFNTLIYKSKLINKKTSKKEVSVCEFGDNNNVKLSNEQFTALIEQFGNTAITEKIDWFDLQIQNQVKKYLNYKDHFATIRNWCKRDKPKLITGTDATLKYCDKNITEYVQESEVDNEPVF